MTFKQLVTIGVIAGSVIGGYVPVLFGASSFSYISVVGSGVGGILGVYIAYKLSNY